MTAIKIIRPAGRPSVAQRTAEAMATNTGVELKEWQKSNNKIASGRSYNGYFIDVKKLLDNTVTTATLKNKAKYINAVLFGRGSGSQPPTADIAKWMQDKGIKARGRNSGRFIPRDKAAFSIARQIGSIGTLAPELSENAINIFAKTSSDRVIKKATRHLFNESRIDFINKQLDVLNASGVTAEFSIENRYSAPPVNQFY